MTTAAGFKPHPCSLAQVKAEKPRWDLAVIAGAVLRTLGHVSVRSAEYLAFLQKGQLPPARISLTSFTEEIVIEGASPKSLTLRTARSYDLSHWCQPAPWKWWQGALSPSDIRNIPSSDVTPSTGVHELLLPEFLHDCDDQDSGPRSVTCSHHHAGVK